MFVVVVWVSFFSEKNNTSFGVERLARKRIYHLYERDDRKICPLALGSPFLFTRQALTGVKSV